MYTVKILKILKSIIDNNYAFLKFNEISMR